MPIAMLANSGLSGFCPVCGHANNEHNQEPCAGRHKKKASKGKSKYEKCKNIWKICQWGGHNFAGNRKDAYMVCRGCSSHPGAGPDGTGPDGSCYDPSSASSGTRLVENSQLMKSFLKVTTVLLYCFHPVFHVLD